MIYNIYHLGKNTALQMHFGEDYMALGRNYPIKNPKRDFRKYLGPFTFALARLKTVYFQLKSFINHFWPFIIQRLAVSGIRKEPTRKDICQLKYLEMIFKLKRLNFELKLISDLFPRIFSIRKMTLVECFFFSPSDWSDSTLPGFDSLRPPASKHQLENLPENIVPVCFS